jgi:hypothetical protein
MNKRMGFAFAAVLGSGCLEPAGSYLSRMDTSPPRVVSSTPVELTGIPGAVGKDAQFNVTFSEDMEPRSLRGGIQLFRGNAPIELVFTLPPAEPGADDVDRGDVPYTVTFVPELGPLEGAARHTLVYSTILTDSQGNALETEARLTFTTAP